MKIEVTPEQNILVDGVAGRCKLSAHAVGKRMKQLHDDGRVALTGHSVKSDSGRAQREWRAA